MGGQVGVLWYRLRSQGNGISPAPPRRSDPGNTDQAQRYGSFTRNGDTPERACIGSATLVRLARSASFAGAGPSGRAAPAMARTAGFWSTVPPGSCGRPCSGDFFSTLERAKVLFCVGPTIMHLGGKWSFGGRPVDESNRYGGTVESASSPRVLSVYRSWADRTSHDCQPGSRSQEGVCVRGQRSS